MRTVGFVVGVLLLLAVALAPGFAAQPFSDVPQGHWAYAAVEKLAAAGLVEGYADGTYRGARNMTRYEFAVAIARLLDNVQNIAKTPGPPGPQGEKGEKGEAGAGGGLTPEQQALLNRLATEFAPELQALRSDLNKLISRVEALEGKPGMAPPVVKITGDIGWRTGVYGTKLGFEDVDSTGYPFFSLDGLGAGSAFGVIPIGIREVSGKQFMFAGIPISDALKDSFKAGDFMAMRTRVAATANIAPNTCAFVQLLAGPSTNMLQANPFLESEVFFPFSPTQFSGNGIMDVVQFDQIYLKYGTRFITPVDLTIGKQYLTRGSGLLFANDQEAIKGLRADFGSGRLRIGTFLAMLDVEEFLGRTAPQPLGLDIDGEPLETNGQDNINLFYLDWAFAGDWKLGGNWLDSGFNKEQGWSVSLSGPLYGLGLYGEYAKLTQWPIGEDFADFDQDGVRELGEVTLSTAGDAAWLAGLKWSNPWIALTGEYGKVEAGYALAGGFGGWDAALGPGFFNLPLSLLHPRAEIDPYDINWIDRPLFLDPTNIAKGWHFQATFPNLLGQKTPLTVSYASGDAYTPEFLGWLISGDADFGVPRPDEWRTADPVWWVKISRQMSDSVTASLLYGRREVDNVMSPRLIPVTDGVFATQDPLQVIRAEVCVQF